MIQKVFAVYDLKACAYLQPFFSTNSGSAMRAFGDAAVDGKSPISAHPGDYQLFEVGTWDDLSGSISALQPMKLLCAASDFVSEKVPVSMPGLKCDDTDPVLVNGKKSS